MKSIMLQQFFYGRDLLRDYCMLASSIDDIEMMNGARETCEAYQSPLAGGLPAPVLMTHVVGRFVLFACVRNGLRDPAGRGTIFYHLLVTETDSLKGTGVDAFGLFASGRFAERLPEPGVSLLPVAVEVTPPCDTSEICVELPAAIETETSDVELFRRILGNQANRVSWVTYASRDMPGFDLIGVQPGAHVSVSRWRYDNALNVIARPASDISTPRPAGSLPARPATTGSTSSPMQQRLSPNEKTSSGLLRLSVILNFILSAALVFVFARKGKSPCEGPAAPPSAPKPLVKEDRPEISIDELRKQFAQKFDEKYSDGRLTEYELRALTEESGTFYQFTDKGWRELHEKQQKLLAPTRSTVRKMFGYVEFMNKFVLDNYSETDKAKKE